MIDGVDECKLSTRSRLLFDLCRLQREASGTIRVLIASRFKFDIADLIRPFMNMKTLKMQSHNDLALYVASRVEQGLASGLLKADLEQYAAQIIQELVTKADGM